MSYIWKYLDFHPCRGDIMYAAIQADSECDTGSFFDEGKRTRVRANQIKVVPRQDDVKVEAE